MAAAKGFGSTSNIVSLNFIKANAELIMKASPVAYVRNAKLRGSLFHPQDNSGLVSGADTQYFVDHEEPLAVLRWAQQNTEWPFGELPDGHEFIMILEPRRRSSRSRSTQEDDST